MYFCNLFAKKSGQELPISNSFVNPHTRTLLSLEGKGSLVVYESADIDSAVEAVVDGCFYSNGQVIIFIIEDEYFINY